MSNLERKVNGLPSGGMLGLILIVLWAMNVWHMQRLIDLEKQVAALEKRNPPLEK